MINASRKLLALAMALTALCHTRVSAAQSGETFRDLVYATVDGKPLALDLYLPSGVKSPPLVVWVHGGAWTTGTKENPPQREFVGHGYALASIDFRQSTEARFPAQVHDIKAAIRFLRAMHARYGNYRVDRIAIMGSSSGGHLAALVGVTNGDSTLEGRVGAHLEQSSSVQAIVDYFGASDLTTILAQSTPVGLDVRRPALDRLLGAQPDRVPQLAELASPVYHVDRGDPPLLLLHGDRDPQMPVNQALELQGAYEKLGLDVELHIVHGAGHGGMVFFTSEYLDHAIAFLRRTIGE